MNEEETREAMALLKEVSVLYVEDELGVRDQLALFIRRRVGTLYLAADGQEGLEVFLQHKPDIVVTDISMPVMDGMEMAKQIKAANVDTPVVITTAYNEVGFLNDAIEIGIDKYLVKPINPKLLVDALLAVVIVLFHHREIEARNRLVRFLLDTHPSFLLTSTCANLELVKNDILSHLGYASHEEMQKYCGSDFFTRMDGAAYPQTESGEWIDHLINHPGIEHILYLVDQNHQHPRAFIIMYNHFAELDKCVFSFTEVPKGAKANMVCTNLDIA